MADTLQMYLSVCAERDDALAEIARHRDLIERMRSAIDDLLGMAHAKAPSELDRIDEIERMVAREVQ